MNLYKTRCIYIWLKLHRKKNWKFFVVAVCDATTQIKSVIGLGERGSTKKKKNKKGDHYLNKIEFKPVLISLAWLLTFFNMIKDLHKNYFNRTSLSWASAYLVGRIVDTKGTQLVSSPKRIGMRCHLGPKHWIFDKAGCDARNGRIQARLVAFDWSEIRLSNSIIMILVVHVCSRCLIRTYQRD